MPPTRFEENWHRNEWLEADGLGGFASATVTGLRTRRYHALLLTALQPPTNRVVLVNGCETWIYVNGEQWPLSINHYSPDVYHPRGDRYLSGFRNQPWPTWTFVLPNGVTVIQELLVPRGNAATALRWSQYREDGQETGCVKLVVRPFLSGRDYHHLHQENGSLNTAANRMETTRVGWKIYPDLPEVLSIHNGQYCHRPEWFRQFDYLEEEDRGLDHIEDLASPGEITWDLSKNSACWLLTSDTPYGLTTLTRFEPADWTGLAKTELQRREQFASPAQRCGESFLVKRNHNETLIAGYPWFTDWGRDTFIALRGLCLATRRWRQALEILLCWSECVSEGMLPNRFPDQGMEPEYNSVDASLLYIIAVHDLLTRFRSQLVSQEVEKLIRAANQIIDGYSTGTRYGIRQDQDGLLTAGNDKHAITWMDACVDGCPVTPRHGKPVEIQALWINALRIAENWGLATSGNWKLSQQSFRQKFWLPDLGYLADVVDVNHATGTVDNTLRPNQIFALGGLPFSLIDGQDARQMMSTIKDELWTPAGIRTLSPRHPHYRRRYIGGVHERDSAYHQGTVWPWLTGPFVEAWIRCHGCSSEVIQQARDLFLTPFEMHHRGGQQDVTYIPEIADAEFPHLPRGCPFQAWSLGEYLRLDREVLAIPQERSFR